ncbi:protein FAM13A [Elysia marginata]|uniref:Protein FAM13A n=1 Tax=Elysia marginata TaxID=1093978 RepID=A0AAV4FZJ3_9GAST|nr:protein FAM13A [Elysia marginata]
MERIKNLISPRARRKKLEHAATEGAGDTACTRKGARTFGVSLDQLVARLPLTEIQAGPRVPFVVRRICEFIYKHGLDNMGLFRVSGSVRVVERLRLQFELTGDVDLEGENDVAATAGLLRVFLRDLPDTLVPEKLTQRFFNIVQGYADKTVILEELKRALELLPEESYNVLKYISSLLVVVAENEAENKMTAYSLAILFGPNVFRYELTSEMGGLRDMDSSKEVMQLFISHYDTLFAEDDEPSPKQFWERTNKRRSPPPRPPPPKVQSMPSFQTPSLDSPDSGPPIGLTLSSSTSSLDYRPVPSPRKIKNVLENSRSLEFDERDTSNLTVNSNSIPLFSPREDLDHNRAISPFTLESETHSIIESPMITARTNEFVEKTIVQTISEHIFGSMDFNQNSGPHSVQWTSLWPNPDRPWQQKLRPVRESMVQRRHDFNGVERAEILTGAGTCSRDKENQGGRELMEGYSGAFNSSPTLGSSNNSSSLHVKDLEVSSPTSNTRTSGNAKAPARRNEDRALTPQSLSVLNSQESSIPEGSVQSPGTAFPMHSSNGIVERSPTNGIKLFIPPLDFSTLHEHVDGTEPIPVSKGQFDTQIWIKTNQLAEPGETNVAVISPRSHKLKKRNGPESVLTAPLSVDIEAPMSPSANSNCGLFRASTNTDIPPSPPIHQDIYKKHSDDDCSYRLRQLTKKISGLKKKIKSFEEAFELQHGYKPSQGERAAQPDVRKYMNELSKARKDLKRLKETTEKGNRSRHNSGASSSGVEPSPPATPNIASTLELILHCLLEKRKEAGRPEELLLMSREQVHDEKLAVQRALLHFEGLHGRPSTREEKDLMRPLYDRYRSVKRMLAKPVSPRNSLELQTVPEDKMIEIPRFLTQRNTIRIPTALDADGGDVGNSLDSNNGVISGRTAWGSHTPSTPTSGGEFGLVTQDLGLLREIEEEVTALRVPANLREEEEEEEDEDGGSGRPEDTGGGGAGSEDSGGGEANLHELSLSELHTEIELSRGKKKRLRRVLKDFEEEFLDMHGRKVQKEDRYPLQSEYSQYKKVKARLRLLEALVLKHHE